MPDHTTTSAAEALGVSKRRVRQLIELGRLKATKHGRDWLIDGASVEELRGQDRKAGRPKSSTNVATNVAAEKSHADTKPSE